MWTAWPSVSIVPSFSIIFYPIKLRGGGCEYAGEADTLVNCYLMNKVRINSANSYRWKLSPHHESFSWNLFWNLRIFFTRTVFPNGANELSALLWWLPCRVPYLQNHNIKEQSLLMNVTTNIDVQKIPRKKPRKTYWKLHKRQFRFAMFGLFILCCFRQSLGKPLKFYRNNKHSFTGNKIE